MYFFPLNTIPVLVCPYWFKKRREIQKTEKQKNRYTKTLVGLGISTCRQKLRFLTLFRMVIGALGIFPHHFFLQAILWFSESFLHLPCKGRSGSAICSLVFLTFLRQFVTEYSENFYEGQKLMYKGRSSQEIMKSIFK